MHELPFRSVLLPLVPPLVPTGAWIAAQLLGAPAPVALSAMAATIAAWAVVALWALRRAEAGPSQAQVMAEQSSLMAELREFVGREVFGAHTELDRSRRLIREAVVQLNGSFRSIEEQSRQQRAMIACLVEEDGAGSAGGVRQFADSAGTLLENLTQSLAGDSRESGRTAQVIGEMVRQLDEVFQMLGDVKDVAEQATRITREAGKAGSDPRSALMVLTYEVRQLASLAGSLHERIQSMAGSSRAVIDRVRDRIERAAERGMTVSVEARTKADDLINQVVAINRSIVSGINMVSQCGVQIRQDVTTAVRALQFEDIANQAMTAATVHVDRLRAINQDAVQLQQVLAATQASAAARERTLDSFGRLLRAKREEWRKPVHKPVSQLTMGAGSVELF
jgi:methyl-accepting chemotaxis protein